MKKVLSALLAAGLMISLSACGDSAPRETEPTMPLPLWAQDEEDRPPIPELTEAETTGPALPETEPTVGLLETEAPETVQTEPVVTETAAPETVSAVTYPMEEKFTSVEPETVYATSNVNIRTAGNVHSDSLGKLGKGKPVTRVGISQDGWSAVLYEDRVCYISSDYLSREEQEEAEENPNVPKIQEVDDQVYTMDDVNMREGPGFDQSVLCRVPEFVELHRTGIVSSGWSRVIYKEQEGYISTGYLSEKHPSETEPVEEEEVDDVVVTTREVNLRKGPGTNRAIIGRIPEGTEVRRIGITDNNWAKVIYEEQTGYVSGDYLDAD